MKSVHAFVQKKRTLKKKPPHWCCMCVPGTHTGQGRNQMYADMTRTICAPPHTHNKKKPHLLFFRAQMATHSITHPHDTQTQTAQKKNKIKTQWSVKDRRTEGLDREKQSNVGFDSEGKIPSHTRLPQISFSFLSN